MKLKNKYGFTLIELLAVIVVLAIIALIATPIVMNTIKNAKKGAAERTADNYIKQVETTIAEERLNKNEVLEGEYQITSDGNLCRDKSASCSDDEKIKIEMSGTKPTSGKIKITNGSVDQTSSSMTVGDYTVSYNSTKKTYEATERSNALVLCKAVTELSTQTYNSNFDGNSHTEKTGVLASDGDPYAYGVEYTCELGDGEQNTFYVLDSSNDTVSLIMSKNIGTDGKETTSEYVFWCTDADADNGGDDSSCNGSGVKEYLSNSTKNWTKLTLDQITIPTELQIKAQIIKGNDIFGNDSEMTKPWLNENLINSKDGYWVYGMMSVSEYGVLKNNRHYIYSLHVGVRPVITISKSQLG